MKQHTAKLLLTIVFSQLLFFGYGQKSIQLKNKNSGTYIISFGSVGITPANYTIITAEVYGLFGDTRIVLHDDIELVVNNKVYNMIDTTFDENENPEKYYFYSEKLPEGDYTIGIKSKNKKYYSVKTEKLHLEKTVAYHLYFYLVPRKM